MLGGARGARARLRGHGRAAPGPPRAPRPTHALSTSSRTFHMFNIGADRPETRPAPLPPPPAPGGPVRRSPAAAAASADPGTRRRSRK